MPKTVEGTEDLLRRLKKMGRAVATDILRDAGRQASEVIAEDARRRAPEGKTKRLVGNLKVRGGRGRKEIVFRIGNTPRAFYARWIEFGTKSFGPKPFLRPALDTQADEAVRVFGEVVRKRLNAMSR